MRILLINKYYYPKGGSEIHLKNLQDLLEQAGHQIAVFAMANERNWPSKYSRYFPAEIDYQRVTGFWTKLKLSRQLIYNRSVRKKLKRLINEFQPEIAHLHNFSHQLSSSIIWELKKHRLPIIQTLHDYKLICPNYKLYRNQQICQSCYRHRYFQALHYRCQKNSFSASLIVALEAYATWLTGVYKKIDHFISPSRFLKQRFITWGFPQEKISILPNFFLSSKNLPITDQGYILFIGRLEPEKGLDDLIKAISRTDIKLKIIGTGSQEKYFQQKLNSKPDLVAEVLGYQIPTKVQEYLADCRFLVVPSKCFENQPQVILEAYSQNKPVVAPAQGGLLELVKDQEFGLLYQPNSIPDLRAKLIALWQKPELAKKYGQKAGQYLRESHHPHNYLKKLIDIYRQVLKRDEK